jgi:uncharacterized phiE125 gp8 family phage protein
MLTDISPPKAQRSQLDALAAYLRLPSGFAGAPDDALLARLIEAAAPEVERATARVLVERAFLLRVESWDCPTRHALPVSPVVSVEALTLVDAAGARSEIAPDRWRLDATAGPPTLRGAPRLPAIAAGGHAEARLIAGYGPEWADAPAGLRHATLTLAAFWYEDAGTTGGGLPPTVAALLAPYRRLRL